MKIKQSLATLAALGLAASVLSAHAFTGEKYAEDTKIGIAAARTIALKAFPGKISDEELEIETGGSGLRYSFDIRSGTIVHEVGVDAKTGKLMENNTEGPNPD